MRFELTLKNTDGVIETLFYDNTASTLTRRNGERVDLSTTGFAYADNVAFTEWKVGRKIRAVKRLKIQLGLGCNYSCSYCSQSAHKMGAVATSTMDASTFIENIDTWLEGEPDKIELWGGEPLLYWKKIKLLAPALRARFPRAVLSVITNGALLDDEKADFLRLHGVRIAISHDGPGHTLRGPDPFDDPEWVAMVQRVYDTHQLAFNMVLTEGNRSPSAAIEWIRSRLGRPVACNVESIVNVYSGEGELSASVRGEISQNLFMDLVTGKLHDVGTLTWKLHSFYHTLAYGEPPSARGQKCGMDRPDWLAVDLDGNVLTCQNVGANSGHKIGELARYDQIDLDTVTPHTQRAGCPSCPVLHLCYGSCMYLHGAEFSQTCNNEYAANLAVFMAALYFLTGYVLTGIQHLDAPAKVKKFIPIKEVAYGL